LAIDFKIRQARRGDRAGLAELLRAHGYPNAADTNTMLWVFNHPEISLFVAVDLLERPVGYVCLSLRPQLRLCGRIATIDEFIIDAGWLNRGVPEALLDAALKRAKDMDSKRIEVTSHEESPIGADFWARHGFARIASEVLGYACGEAR
jgi:N-acetylglutamate synthase-like GNAT family acetyltransferase